MKFYSIFIVFYAFLYTIDCKKCCNSECTQVISQARSFREYIPTDSDGLTLERDAKIWIFMKEMGLDNTGAEMWYGESRGKKGYFPKHLVGEYMVLCRDLVDIGYEFMLNQAEEKRENEEDGVKNREEGSEDKREEVEDGAGKPDEEKRGNEEEKGVESREIPEGGDRKDDKTPELEENRDSEGETSSPDNPNKEIPDMVNEWRNQDGDSFNIPPQEKISEFHAPDTEAMQALKREMDRDFLSRLLEGEGVETIGELDDERLNELMRDPNTARILLKAIQDEEVQNDPRSSQDGLKLDVEKLEHREISQPEKETQEEPVVEEHEISQSNAEETNLPQSEEVGNKQENQELPQEDKIDDSIPDTPKTDDVGKLPQGEKDDSDTQQSDGNPDEQDLPHEEKADDGNSDDGSKAPQDEADSENKNEVGTDQNLDQGEDADVGNPDTSETNGEVEEQKPPQDEKVEGDDLETNTEDNHKLDPEISPDQVNDTPTESAAKEKVPERSLLDILPFPVSNLLKNYIQNHGIASLLLYTLTPILIAYLYLSRNGARNRVNLHKKESTKHMQVLEQKVIGLQKEKKVLELKIAESNENAVSKNELQTLKQDLDTARNEIEGNRCYISQLETNNTQQGEELQTSQAGLNEKCVQIERLQTLNSSAQEEILALNGKIDAANDQVTQIETEKMALQVRIDANIESYSELKDKMDGVEKSRDQVEREKVKLEQELKEKQVLITANSEQIHTLEGEIAVLSKSLLKLQPGGGQLSQNDARAIFDTLTNTAKALSELEEAKGVKDRLERENSHLSTENNSIKARCEDLDDNLSCVKSNNILLKKQLGDSETKLQVLNEYFNTKESELHRQLNEVKNSQMLLEGKDQRTHEEIGAVRTEREALKLEISALKQQHAEREKSLLDQIASLEKRAQENLYNSRRNEQDIRWRDREITELKRKLGESSLPSSQSESYLSPRSASPSSQISSNSDTEGGVKIDKTRESPSLPKFTSGPPTKVDPITTTSKQPIQQNPFPQGYPPHSYFPPPYPGMMPPFAPRPLMPQGMGPAVFNSPSVPVKRGKGNNVRQSAPEENMATLRPVYLPDKMTAQVENMAPKPQYAPEFQTVENLAPNTNYPPESYAQQGGNMAPKPALYAPSPPTLIDTPNEYTEPPALFDTSQENAAQQYNGSLLDSQNNTPTQNDSNTFLIDV